MSDDEECGRHPLAQFIEPAPCGSGLRRRYLDIPGGYLWWYVDLVDERGDGLVVIWSYGLPFLPGYAGAARRCRGQTPRSRPSLNVATYRGGSLDFYLLQEYESDELRWRSSPRGDCWRFGDSRLYSLFDGQRRQVELDLRLDVPGIDEVVRLELRGEGKAVHRPGSTHQPLRKSHRPLLAHDWVPLVCACDGEAILKVGGEETSFSGRLYHDRNAGALPFDELGLRRWMWGRFALSRGEVIYYLFEADDGQVAYALWSVDKKGRLQKVPAASLERQQQQRNGFGLRWWSTMTVDVAGLRWLDIEHRRVVDSGPFYLRTLSRAVDRRGRVYPGVSEVCEPDRNDRARHRPLVRMRVHRRGKKNSMWLPLFTGPRRGRVQRLIQSWI